MRKKLKSALLISLIVSAISNYPEDVSAMSFSSSVSDEMMTMRITKEDVLIDVDVDDMTTSIQRCWIKKSSTDTSSTVSVQPSAGVLTASSGVNYNQNGNKETYYNLDMSGVVSIMRGCGFAEAEYPYWVREDGVKMLGGYVMVAANLDVYPRGTTVYTSLGTGLVCDTGGFASSNPTQLDIAVSW